MDTFESAGMSAGDLVVDIFVEDTKSLPPPVRAAHAYRVDARQLERRGLSTHLPAGPIVLFQEPTLWQAHRKSCDCDAWRLRSAEFYAPSYVGPGGEALSGLARAFFYAGARAVLVGHRVWSEMRRWSSTKRTFAELRQSPSIGRAEAFRRSMQAIIHDKSRPDTAHPSFWAPFVVMEEGGAR